jgi:protein-S-isoprenylcysteine O-methyltransferase Ste14
VPAVALAFHLTFLIAAFGWRSWVQYRRTGDIGFRGFSRDSSALERVVGTSFVIALVVFALLPLMRLLGLTSTIPLLDRPAVHALGLILAVSGIGITVLAQVQMGESWRIGVDSSETTALIQHGLFGRVRNPIFSGMLVESLGIVLLVPGLLSAAVWLALLTAIELQVRRVEEPYLLRTHGLEKIAHAGQLRRALFVCDRDELRAQGLAALQNTFGADAAAVTSGNPQKNARILVATYQTLDVASDDADATFLVANHPRDYFSHIVIDECHRSAWGKWSEVLTRNPGAVQIGLTATPRQLVITERTAEAQADARISADNIRHFGEPVYEYDIAQGIEDGYLAACEIVRRDIFLEAKLRHERETGLDLDDLAGKRVTDAITGELLTVAETRARYEAKDFEERLQKTIVFCARDRHAEDVAIGLNNLYAAW